MISAIFSFFGKDKQGIIAGVTEILFKNKINLEDVSMTILEDQLAMMMIVSANQMSCKELELSLSKHFKRLGINLQITSQIIRPTRSSKPKHGAQTSPYLLHVMGKDQTGIVYRFSREIAAQGLNITDMNCKILGFGTKTLYALAMELDVPFKNQKTRIKQLSKKLEQISAQLGLEISLKPLDLISA